MYADRRFVLKDMFWNKKQIKKQVLIDWKKFKMELTEPLKNNYTHQCRGKIQSICFFKNSLTTLMNHKNCIFLISPDNYFDFKLFYKSYRVNKTRTI